MRGLQSTSILAILPTHLNHLDLITQTKSGQGDALSPLLFNLALEYSIRQVQETRLGLDVNGNHQVLANADDVNLIGDVIRI